jgi:hypothetical protein
MSTIATGREGKHLQALDVERLKTVVLVLKVNKSASRMTAYVAMCVVIMIARNIATDLIILPFVQNLWMEVVHVLKAKRGVVPTLMTTTLDGAQMFAAIKRQRKPVTTTMGVLLTLPVQQLPMGAAHAKKIK